MANRPARRRHLRSGPTIPRGTFKLGKFFQTPTALDIIFKEVG